MKSIYFVHVPKTAGTSFRKAAESYFTKEKVFYDYGPNQPETSKTIKDFSYSGNDIFGVNERLSEENIKILGGHIPVRRYAPIFPSRRIITFVREPLARLVSEYKHFKRNYGFDGELIDFIQRDEFTNRQVKMLQGFSPQLFGFIGITENYHNSLALFNNQFDVNLEDLSLNLAGKEKAPVYQVNSDVMDIFEKRNQHDINYYNASCKLFKQRLQLLSDGMPFVHGQIGSCKDGKVFGWAFWGTESNDAVELTIKVNEQKSINVHAKEYRPGLAQFNVPRKAYVGYSANVGSLHSGDSVRVFVTKTGQELVNSPFIINNEDI